MNNKGFTLIELIASIAILSLILLLVVPRVTNLSSSAKEAERQAKINTINSSAQDYVNDYINDFSECTSLKNSDYLRSSSCTIELSKLIEKNYLESDNDIIIDPVTNNNFTGKIYVCYDADNSTTIVNYQEGIDVSLCKETVGVHAVNIEKSSVMIPYHEGYNGSVKIVTTGISYLRLVGGGFIKYDTGAQDSFIVELKNTSFGNYNLNISSPSHSTIFNNSSCITKVVSLVGTYDSNGENREIEKVITIYVCDKLDEVATDLTITLKGAGYNTNFNEREFGCYQRNVYGCLTDTLPDITDSRYNTSEYERWYSWEENSDTKSYEQGDRVELKTEDNGKTLYATIAKKLNITLKRSDLNDFEDITYSCYAYDDASGCTAKIMQAPTVSGYTFAGWYTKKSNGTLITTSRNAPITSNTTAYPQYNTRVTLALENVTSSANSKNIRYKGSGTFTLTANRKYTLDGATVSCDGGATAAITGSTLKVSNVTKAQTCRVAAIPSEYEVKVNVTNGTSDPTSKYVNTVSSATFTITPTFPYILSNIEISCDNALYTMNYSTNTLVIDGVVGPTICNLRLPESYTCPVGDLVNDASKGYICKAKASTEGWYYEEDEYACGTDRYTSKSCTDCGCKVSACEYRCNTQFSNTEENLNGCLEACWIDDGRCHECNTCEVTETRYCGGDIIYYCQDGWARFSGNGSSLICYQSAQ